MPDSRRVPTVKVGGEAANLIDAWLYAKESEQAAIDRRKQIEADLASEGKQIWVSRCRKDGCIHPAIRLRSKAGRTVRLVQPSRYQRMSAWDCENQLESIFGREGFEQYFDVHSEIHIDLDKLTDCQNEHIVTALCREAVEMLTVQALVVPNEQYHRDRVLRASVAWKAESAEAEGLAIPFSPGLKPETSMLEGG